LEAAGRFSALTTFRCADTRITNAGLKYLSGLHNLSELDLSHNDITYGALEPIEKLPISKLVLRQTQITNDDLQSIAKISQLNTLDLSHTKISGTGGLSYLTKSQIVSLDLSGTSIDDSALDSAAQMKELTSLRITDCKLLSATALTKLHEKRPTLSIVNKKD
jgi:Leucine-rich repeat (LRR) protein